MSYRLCSVTLRTDNSSVGLAAIDSLWEEIQSGKLPLLFDSDGTFIPGVSPVSRYSNYESDALGAYDLTVMAVRSDFFAELERKVKQGLFRKFEAAGDDCRACAQSAWAQVWAESQSGTCRRAFTEDYESTVPAPYTKDGTCHCYLYISL